MQIGNIVRFTRMFSAQQIRSNRGSSRYVAIAKWYRGSHKITQIELQRDGQGEEFKIADLDCPSDLGLTWGMEKYRVYFKDIELITTVTGPCSCSWPHCASKQNASR
jgi:hypothetical protein